MSSGCSGKRLFSPCSSPCNNNNGAYDTSSSLLCLPEELLFGITSFLDARSLLTLRRLNSKFRDLASRNEAGWTILCRDLWKDKVHVLDEACHSPNAMQAYRESLQDAKDRQCLTLDELCYDESNHTGTIWSFRFKEAAGPDWTRHDPWYNGLVARKMVFLRNGTVKQYLPSSAAGNKTNPEDHHILVTPNFGDDSRLSASLSPSRMEEDDDDDDDDVELPLLQRHQAQVQLEQRRQQQVRLHRRPQQHRQPGVLVNPPLSMTWRFLKRPIDLPNRPMGSYIRLTVGGRDVPTYVVRRSPTGNWGFVCESLWGVYASFELPPRRTLATLSSSSSSSSSSTSSSSSLSSSSQRRRPSPSRNNDNARTKKLRRASSGQVIRVPLDVDSSDDDDNDDDDHVGESDSDSRQRDTRSASCQSDNMLLDDSEMLITNEVQWREAYLYNWGARILPDGDAAVDEILDHAILGAVLDG